MLMAEHQHLAEQGVSLVELRLDFIRRPVNMRRLLENRGCPCIATVRRPKEGGKWMRSEEDRLMLLRTAIADGVDYVDLEYDIANKIPRYGKTKRIVSYHNFQETPDNLEQIHQAMAKLDADYIKIATQANNPLDNIRVLKLVRAAKIPTIGFCMGEMGVISRILCGKFGSPWTYASFHEDRQLAPGQLSYKQMNEEYHYDQITLNTGILGVIADPVAHSLSPRVHNACIRKLGLDLIYLPFRVTAEYLDAFVESCLEMDIRGLSVTLPHKEKIMKHCNVLDDQAVAVRAVNTVVFKEVNTFGYNTDLDAAVSVLTDALQMPSDHPAAFEGKRVLILGAGGVARTIAIGMLKRGASVFLTARDYRKSEQVANELKCKSIDWPARQNFECHILINATPLGMHPDMDASPFEAEWFDKHTVVFDTIYNPEQTLFIKHARQAGCPTITGVDMFVRQAAKQFELFTGQAADLNLIRYEVKRGTSAAKY